MESSSTNHFHVIINPRSGTALKMGHDGIMAALEESGLDIHHLHMPEPEDFAKIAEELAQQDLPVLIGGGDGTIMQTAPIFRKHRKAFGFLPMGTMNLLAADLGIPFSLPECLAAYAGGVKAIDVDVAEANGTPFLCCAGIGVMPEASTLREDHRDEPSVLLIPRLTMFVLGQLDKTRRRSFRIVADRKKKKHIRTNAIVVSNNPFDMDDPGSFKRKSLSHGILGLYIATPRSLWDRIRLILRLHTGGWKRDPVMRQMVAEKLVIHSRRRSETVSLDGENVDLSTPIVFSIHKAALQILVPTAILDTQ